MTQEEVLQVFREAGALLNGHFILSSGLRSPVFRAFPLAQASAAHALMESSAHMGKLVLDVRAA